MHHLEKSKDSIAPGLLQKNILVVDDETAFLHAVKKLFQNEEFSICTAETLGEAIELIRQKLFHVVITDIRLTDVMSREGLEILKYAKSFRPETKVIILTGYGNSDVMEQAYELGASLYIEKPVSANLLRNIIKNHVREL